MRLRQLSVDASKKNLEALIYTYFRACSNTIKSIANVYNVLNALSHGKVVREL